MKLPFVGFKKSGIKLKEKKHPITFLVMLEWELNIKYHSHSYMPYLLLQQYTVVNIIYSTYASVVTFFAPDAEEPLLTGPHVPTACND